MNLSERVLSDLKNLVTLSSTSSDLDGIHSCQQAIQETLYRYPLNWERVLVRDAADFLIARSEKMDNSKPVVIFSGHIDTVLPARGYTVEGDIVFGSGVNDMKGGIISMLEIVRQLHEEDKLQNVILAISPEEEVATPHHRQTIEKISLEGDYVMVFEANQVNNAGNSYQTGEWELVSARKGAIVYEFELNGPGGHSGDKFAQSERHSTVLPLAFIITKLEELADYRQETTLNPGLVKAGEAVNILAATARLTGEGRFWNLAERERIVAGLNAIVDEVTKIYPRIQIEFSLKGEFPPLESSVEGEKLIGFAEIVARELGLKLSVTRRSGAAEGSMFKAGNPKIGVLDGFGPSGSDEHQLTENASLQSLEDSINFGKALTKRIIFG